MPPGPDEEVLFSVDVEASGASPTVASLLSIGACLVHEPDEAFYVELRPIAGLTWSEAAERVHGLSRTHLDAAGAEPADAMRSFADWVDRVARGRRPIFTAFNAVFDWMFVADYLHRFIGTNPFGISGLDLKAYYMARHGVAAWAQTGRDAVRRRYPTELQHTHHALDDAREQAELARRLLDRRSHEDGRG